ncbi:MAG: hypothetical protein MJ064_03005 [Lachnospiraceae bacterium]|nr:hypothetical protein [Lachnospiraceae bacterium]
MYTCGRVFNLHWRIFLGVSIFVGVFAAIYEHYGHGVMSNAMIFAFLYPLLLGFLPTIVLACLRSVRKMEYAGGIRAGVNLLYSGIASLTVGSIVTGVVEIYGTTYYLLVVYSYVGVILTVLGTLVTIIALARETGRAAKRA